MKQTTFITIVFLTILAAPAATAISFTDTPQTDHETYVGVGYQFDIETENESNVQYNASNLPTWLSLNANTGVIQGTPSDEDEAEDGITLSITATNQSNSSDTATTSYDLIVNKGLVIDEVEVNGDEVDAGDEVDDEVEIDDEVDIIATLENRLENIEESYLTNDDEDIDIEDVEMDTTSDDLDPADNLEDEVDIDAGDDEDLTVSFTMDPGEFDVEDEPFEIEIQFEGEDDNSVSHAEDFDFELGLDVEDEDLRFDTGAFGSSVQNKQLRCGERSLTVDTTLQNVGQDDLDEPAVGYDSNALGIDMLERLDELDQGDDTSITQRFSIQERPAPGEYFIDVIAYPDRGSDERTDTLSVSVTVEDCAPVDDEDEGVPSDGEDDDSPTNGDDEEDNGGIDVGREPNQGQAGPVGEPVVIGSGESQDGISDEDYLYVLAGLVAVLIVTTGWMLGRVFS